jgi:predicted outer membrane repeat protein
MEQFYLEFTEFDDKYYSTDEDGENDEFSVVGSALKAVGGVGNKKLKYTDSKYRKTGLLNVGARMAARYKDARHQDKLNYIKKKAAFIKANPDSKKKSVKDQAQEVATSANKRTTGILGNSSKGRKRGGAIAATTAVGAAAGAGIGNLASKKWKSQLAALKVKRNQTTNDIAEIKLLKRKIAAATIGGGLVGAGAGFAGGKKFIKK